MKSNQCLVALALGLGLALGLLWLLGSQNSVALADPGILYVAPGGDCGGATPCYATVQAAVDAASAGDEIRVAAGTYTGVSARAGVTQTVYISKTVTIRGGYTTSDWDTPDPEANQTTLDAQGQGRVVYITGDITPRLEGLHITGGNPAGMGGDLWTHYRDAGGGVYAITATVTISNSEVFSNTAESGGGIYLYHSDDAKLTGNEVYSNTADYGGGVYLAYSDDATLTGNEVYNNTANDRSGGVFFRYSDNAKLTANEVYSNMANWHGGGAYFLVSTNATLTGNEFFSNTAGYGGGIYLSYSHQAELKGNTIYRNTAYSDGGGICLSTSGSVMLMNNMVMGNQINGNASASGAGLRITAIRSLPAYLLHSTFARNSGGDGSGISVGSDITLELTNTILVGHTVGITITKGSTATLEATLWYDNGSDTGGGGIIVTGTVNVYDAPAFVNPAAWDYHLTAGSAAIDQGVDAGVTTDIDGDTRPQGAGYDIGADEFRQWYVYLPLVMKNYAH